MTVPRVLAIAGSDPSGGAGIQADLKAIAASSGYGMAAITALTAQNTVGVTAVHAPPAAFLTAQLDAVHTDVEIDAVKIGMLGEASIADAVAEWLDRARPPAVVLDPVMVTTSGARLLSSDAELALLRLLPHADVITPNLPELAALAGEPPAADWPSALAQAGRLAARYGIHVLAKGGHLSDARSPDALVAPDGGLVELDGPRVATTNTHGTGCSLSSALATRYAITGDWSVAARDAKEWLTEAIVAGAALRVGQGHGPVDHFVRHRDVDDATRTWWDDTADVRRAIDALPFVTGLADGTLDRSVFRNYLEQDALYLRDYARTLARASALAPTREEQAFWAGCAQNALDGELKLHEDWLGGPPHAEPSRVTRAYLDHLAAAGPDYGTIVAAALPCFWIYHDLGQRLADHRRAGHPYEAWLDTYADPDFATATSEAIRSASLAAARADAAGRARMGAAFRRSAQHELDFFDQQPGEGGNA